LVIMTFGVPAPPRGAPACGNELGIERFEIRQDGVERHVRVGAAIL
jgi:hypothetical protein